jgi:hypothetical protein
VEWPKILVESAENAFGDTGLRSGIFDTLLAFVYSFYLY